MMSVLFYARNPFAQVSNGVCKGRDERKLSTFSGCHETWRTSVGFVPFLRRVNTKASENVLLITNDIIRSFSSAVKQTSPIHVTHSRHTKGLPALE